VEMCVVLHSSDTLPPLGTSAIHRGCGTQRMTLVVIGKYVRSTPLTSACLTARAQARRCQARHATHHTSNTHSRLIITRSYHAKWYKCACARTVVVLP